MSIPDKTIPYPFSSVEKQIQRLLFHTSEILGWSYQAEHISEATARYTFYAPPDDSGRIVMTTITAARRSESETAFTLSWVWDSPPEGVVEYPEAEGRAMLEKTREILTGVLAQLPPPRRTANQIIESYYRRRGRHNPKLKFAQHLRDLGEEGRESYIRKVKNAYDKEHKKRSIG